MQDSKFAKLSPNLPLQAQRGFTLIEILIAVGVVAIVSSIAIPAYTTYTARAAIAESITELSRIVLLTEKEFQDKHDYADSKSQCSKSPAPANNYFTFTCTKNTATYLWTAKNKAGVGLGPPDSYIFLANEKGESFTAAYPGASITTNSSILGLPCWKTSNSVSC